MSRDFKKEAEWAKKVYKMFFFRCRIDNGELDRMTSVLDGKPFSDWVRKHLAEDYEKSSKK